MQHIPCRPCVYMHTHTYILYTKYLMQRIACGPCVCMYIYACAFVIFIFIFILIFIMQRMPCEPCVCMYIHVCMHVYAYVHACIYVCVCMYIRVCMPSAVLEIGLLPPIPMGLPSQFDASLPRLPEPTTPAHKTLAASFFSITDAAAITYAQRLGASKKVHYVEDSMRVRAHLVASVRRHLPCLAFG